MIRDAPAAVGCKRTLSRDSRCDWGPEIRGNRLSEFGRHIGHGTIESGNKRAREQTE